MNPPPAHQREGMIDKTFRKLGEHPKVCLLPALGFGLLAGAHLLVSAYGEKLMPEPFGYLAALAFVLATLASLNVALAWWVRDTLANQITALKVRQIGAEHQHAADMRNPGVIIPQPPGWNTRDARPLARGHAYRSEHARSTESEDQPDPDWTRELFLPPLGLDPPSDDVSKSA